MALPRRAIQWFHVISNDLCFIQYAQKDQESPSGDPKSVTHIWGNMILDDFGMSCLDAKRRTCLSTISQKHEINVKAMNPAPKWRFPETRFSTSRRKVGIRDFPIWGFQAGLEEILLQIMELRKRKTGIWTSKHPKYGTYWLVEMIMIMHIIMIMSSWWHDLRPDIKESVICI